MALTSIGIGVFLLNAFAQDPNLELPETPLVVAEGLEATLFASEPMINAPTNMAIDHRGRVWINEGVNYREERQAEGDRIMILEDTDGDGKADTSKTFYQGTDVNAAMGLSVLGNMAIVSSAPNILLLTDTDGDDRADQKKLLFTGMGGTQHDHSVHTVIFGPDGKLYFAIGNTGAGSLANADGSPALDSVGKLAGDYPQSKVYRCNLDGTELETIGWNFRNPYELTADSFGNLWQSDNDDGGSPAIRINQIFESGDHGYRPTVRSNGPITGASPIPQIAHWHQNDPGVVPNLILTGTGAPTGIAVYEGTLLPERYHGQLIHADAGPNIVRSYSISRKDSGYTADILPLIHSPSSWFRPSDVTVAPDGSLFIADWMDPACGGHRAMATRGGRIYRIAPPNTPYKTNLVDFSSPESATEALTSPNNETRYLAWSALEAFGKRSIPPLEKLYQSSNPILKARALWLLAHPKLSGEARARIALNDENETMRLVALRAIKRYEYDLQSAINTLVTDSSSRIRRECAIALRFLTDSPQGVALWAQLAKQHVPGDRWYLEALGIGSDLNREACFKAWMEFIDNNWNTPAGRDIVWRSKTEASIPYLISMIKNPDSTQQERERCFRLFDYFDGDQKDESLLTLIDVQHPDRASILALTLKHLEKADPEASPRVARAVAELLETSRGTFAYLTTVRTYERHEYGPAVLNMALAHPTDALGYEAIRVLVDLKGGSELIDQRFESADKDLQTLMTNLIGASRSEKAAAILVKYAVDPARPVDQRLAMVRALKTTSNGARGVFAYLEEGTLPRDMWNGTLDILVTCAYANVVDWCLDEIVKRDGGRLPINLNQLLSMPADPTHGEAVFNQSCVVCHKVGDNGIDFGPNLTFVGNKLEKYALFDSILNPSAGIEFNYEGFAIELKNGQTLAGIIIDENEVEITLNVVGGTPILIKQSDIVSKEQLATSLMPAGLERAMTPQAFVDLVGYLETLK